MKPPEPPAISEGLSSTVGVCPTPRKFVVQKADSQAELVRQVANFLSYLESCGITSLLPPEVRAGSAETAGTIHTFAELLRAARTSRRPLTATARFWIEEVGDFFDSASQRLDELQHASEGHGLAQPK